MAILPSIFLEFCQASFPLSVITLFVIETYYLPPYSTFFVIYPTGNARLLILVTILAAILAAILDLLELSTFSYDDGIGLFDLENIMIMTLKT